MLETLDQTLRLYARCAMRATSNLLRNWLILPASAALVILISIAASLLVPFGPAAGFLIGLFQILGLTLYLTWISSAVNGERVSLREMREIDWSLFYPVLNVSFLIWIIEFLLGSFAAGSSNWPLALFRLGIVLVCNSLGEQLYLARDDGFEALRNSAVFTRANAPEWYAPFLLLLSPLLLASPHSVPLILSQAHPILPASVVALSPLFAHRFGLETAVVIGVILTNWFTVFRGLLYKELSSGSRRQRAFLARQR